MLKINKIKPVFNKIVTTCDVYQMGKSTGGIIIKTDGTIKEYQRVEAVGSTVRDIKVGDIVMIKRKRYLVARHNDKPDSVKNVNGDEVTFSVDFPILEYGGKKHLLIYDQDIDYIIDGEEVEDEQTKSSLILPNNKIIV